MKLNYMKRYPMEIYIRNTDNIISSHDTGRSSKTFWQIMGRFMGKNNTYVNILSLHTGDNKFAFSNLKKCKEM